jgi:hypothetical protein
MEVPPSRYRVVERGRRLVVLDSWNGDAPVVRAPPPSLDRPGAEPEPDEIRTDLKVAALALRAGSARPILETRAWFDDKAPRRILLDTAKQGRASLLFVMVIVLGFLMIVAIGWPVLLVLGWLLFTPALRKAMRRFTTRWLDRAGQEVR